MKLSDEKKKQLIAEVLFSASKSSGPGGQNVNKVNTRVELRFDVNKSVVLTEWEKNRIKIKLKNRMNSKGELILAAQTGRSQLENKENVSELFSSLIEKALTVQKKRKKSSPTLSSKIKRLESKKITAQKKQLRKPPEH